MTEKLIAAGLLGMVIGFLLCILMLWFLKRYAEIEDENPNKLNQ